MRKNKFTILVPCYNEEHRIADTVVKLKEFLLQNPGSEVIFIDDGSIDRTIDIIENSKCDGMIIAQLSSNIGKWGAICAGASLAKGDYCIMCDADYSVDINSIVQRLSLVEGVDVVFFGNRYNYLNRIPAKRRIPGRIFNFLARKIVGIRYIDTQTPFKLWSNTDKLRGIFTDIIECGFAGDVEFLRRCDNEKVQVRMLQIHYKFVEGSSVNMQKHAWPMFKALWRIRANVK